MTTTSRRNVALLTAALVLAGTAALATPARAAQAPPGAGDRYVALGSSYAAGGGLGPAASSDPDGWCGRTTIGYPYLVADALDLDLTNVTCGGATTDHITAPQPIRNQDGTHVAAPQADAITEDTDLVTITVGGNDVSYARNLVARACRGDLAIDPASPVSNGLAQYGVCDPASDAEVAAALAGVEDDMVATVEAVRAKAPDARIVLVDYLTVLPQDGRACGVVPIPREQQKDLLDVARELALATKHAARRAGADLVEASRLSRHHHACSADPWMIGYEFSRGFVMMHPNEAGHQAVADAVVQRLRNGH